MNDLISREGAIRLYCRESCGWEPEKCPLKYERDGTEDCSFVRFLKELPSVQPDAKDINVIRIKGQFAPEELGLIKDNPACYIIPDPAQKHGRWIIDNGSVCCSECGEPNMEWNYCPNCGAIMDMEME